MHTTVGAVPFHGTAYEAFLQLPSPDQARIAEALAGLAGVAWADWPADRLRKLPDHPAFVFRVGPDLRVFLLPPDAAGGPPTVLDVARAKTVAAFART